MFIVDVINKHKTHNYAPVYTNIQDMLLTDLLFNKSLNDLLFKQSLNALLFNQSVNNIKK